MTEKCACLNLLIEKGYVQPNLLDASMVFLYPIVNNKVGKSPLLMNYCPICGLKIVQGDSE